MADFVAVLKRTIGGLSNNTPEARERVYQKARDTVSAKLAAMQPPPSSIVVERQKKALETAISAVESGYAQETESEDEFAAIFAGTAEKEVKKPDIAPLPEEKSKAASGTGAAEAEVAATRASAEPADAGKAAAEIEPVSAGEAGNDEATAEGGASDLKPAVPVARPEPVLAGSQTSRNQKIVPDGGVPRRERRRGVSGAIAAVVAILLVAAAGYGIWLNRDAFVGMFATGDDVAAAPEEEGAAPAEEEPAAEEVAPAEEMAAVEEPATGSEPVTTAAAEDEPQKFTQRLTPEGDEVDPGPAGGERSVGEGTSIATATQPGDSSADAGGDSAPSGSSDGDEALPVGQRAIFYEERTTASDSTAETGSTVWSVVQESPGGDLPPEPAIRAEVTVPSKGLRLRMTIRRNGDPSLPASHIIEMIFLTPEGFEGGGIDNVLRVAFKPTEAAAGSPLLGIPAKIADGYFLIALSDVEEERAFNLRLMRQQSWIDIPVVYGSGRRALVTMERGVPGDRAFTDVLETWEAASAGEQSSAAAEE